MSRVLTRARRALGQATVLLGLATMLGWAAVLGGLSRGRGVGPRRQALCVAMATPLLQLGGALIGPPDASPADAADRPSGRRRTRTPGPDQRRRWTPRDPSA